MRNARPTALLACLLLTAVGCGRSDREVEVTPHNLVLITADTVRADHLQTYGYHRATAPNIDAFAKESLVFDRCLAPMAQTTPSHVSLMTGVYPIEHGVKSNFARMPEEKQRELSFRPTEGLATFAQCIQDEFHTAGFVGAAPVKRLTGLANGFETWSEPDSTRRPGDVTNEDVFDWLQAYEGGPFFLWVHYMDAHGPYGPKFYPPEQFATRFETDDGLREFFSTRKVSPLTSGHLISEVPSDRLTNLYDGSILLLDKAVKKLFDALKTKGVWDSSVIVFMSDHGQGLGQHDYAGHGDVWDEQLKVPLMIRAPGIEHRRVDSLLSTIDVLPTAARLMGGQRVFDGFLQQSRGSDALSSEFKEPYVFGMGNKEASSFCMVEGDWKFILRLDGDNSLHSMSEDPFELNNLLEERPKIAARMLKQLAEEIRLQKEYGEARAKESSPEAQTDAKHLEELRALGYVDDGEED